MRAAVRKLMVTFERIGFDPADTTDTRLQKRVLVVLSALVSVFAGFWGLTYLALDEPLAASIPLSYAVLSSSSLAVFAVTRRYVFFRDSQLTLILLLPFLVMVTLGGFVNSSAVILWSLLAPLGALLVSGRRTATYWFVAFAGLVVMSRILEPSVRATNNLSDDVVLRFFVLNIVGLSFVAFVLLQYFVGQRDEAVALLNVEKEKSERLLLNILPEEIAERLKAANTMIADHYESASVLFADIVDFTPMSARMSPQELVGLLNDVFTTFDGFVAELGLEKIKTVGDAYMVASGVPGARPDHADAIAELALRIRDHVAANQFDGHEITLRIGINSGPVVAGIIGTDKFAYDLWGDAVNTASRMESAGVAGSIQLTPATYELIRDTFVCEPRGVVSVKGKGDMDTYLLISRRADARASG